MLCNVKVRSFFPKFCRRNSGGGDFKRGEMLDFRKSGDVCSDYTGLQSAFSLPLISFSFLLRSSGITNTRAVAAGFETKRDSAPKKARGTIVIGWV